MTDLREATLYPPSENWHDKFVRIVKRVLEIQQELPIPGEKGVFDGMGSALVLFGLSVDDFSLIAPVPDRFKNAPKLLSELMDLHQELSKVNASVMRLVGREYYFATWQRFNFTPSTQVKKLPALAHGPVHVPDPHPPFDPFSNSEPLSFLPVTSTLLKPVKLVPRPQTPMRLQYPVLHIAYHEKGDTLYYADEIKVTP